MTPSLYNTVDHRIVMSRSLSSQIQQVTSKHVAPLGDNDGNESAFFVPHCRPLGVIWDYSLSSQKQQVTSKHVAPLVSDDNDNDVAFFALHCRPLGVIWD